MTMTMTMTAAMTRKLGFVTRMAILSCMLSVVTRAEDMNTSGYNLTLDISHRLSLGYAIRSLPDTMYAFQADDYMSQHWRIDYENGHFVHLYKAIGVNVADYDQNEVAKALSYLPVKLLGVVDEVLLDPVDGGSSLAQTPWNAEKRGILYLFTESGGYSVGELGGILAHEAGHSFINLNYSAGQEPWISYQRILAGEANYPSQYARSGEFEDFAEAVELYVWSFGKPEFAAYRVGLPRRWLFLEEHVFGNLFTP